jgi:hypothetical protein
MYAYLPVRNALSSLSGPNRQEMREDWRKLHTQEIHDWYASPNIVQLIMFLYYALQP